MRELHEAPNPHDRYNWNGDDDGPQSIGDKAWLLALEDREQGIGNWEGEEVTPDRKSVV